jgi:hypothetical protein
VCRQSGRGHRGSGDVLRGTISLGRFRRMRAR